MTRSGNSSRPALLCFDGSDHARRAIAEAGALLEGGTALVVHAWEPLSSAFQHNPGITWPDRLINAAPEIDAASEETAHWLAEQGVELARAAGFEAGPIVSEASDGLSAEIAAVAEQHDASVIVLGSRGLSTPRAGGLGGVARVLLESCKRPTLVI